MIENNYYDKYIQFTKEIDKNKFCRGVDLIDQNERGIYKKLNLYTFCKTNGYTYVKISRDKFNKLLAEIAGRRFAYVFNQDNELIDGHYNLSVLQRKYGNNRTTIKNRLNQPNLLSKDYYYSYDKNFIIPSQRAEKRPLDEAGLTKHRAIMDKIKEKNKIKHRAMAEDLMSKAHLLTRSFEKIGQDYGYTHKGISNLFLNNEIFKEVAELRKELILKATKKYQVEQNKLNAKKIKEGFVSNGNHMEDVRHSKLLVEKFKLDQKNANIKIKRIGKLGSDGLRDKLAYLRKDKKISKQLNEY